MIIDAGRVAVGVGMAFSTDPKGNQISNPGLFTASYVVFAGTVVYSFVAAYLRIDQRNRMLRASLYPE